MKVHLMHPDADFDLRSELPAHGGALTQDLELATLWTAMAGGDRVLFDVAVRALLLSLRDPEEIVYRQQVLTDCLEHPQAARELYALAGEALTAEAHVWGGILRDSPRSRLSTSLNKLEVYVDFLRRLREMADRHGAELSSPGFTRFFAMVVEELDEDYFQRVESQLRLLRFKGGVLSSARLAAGNRGTGYVLRHPREQGLVARVLDRSGMGFTIPDRDEAGMRAVGELEERGLNPIANALSQSVDHLKSFFVLLRAEVGFYVACLNLADRLEERGEPTCLPIPVAAAADERALATRDLYDVCLALTLDTPAVGNDLRADGARLVVITGANQGGKSTLLRAVGVAQLMLQAGMFVGAHELRASVCDGLFTHCKRAEDEELESGKLDEELRRMSAIADRIAPHSMLLCNESFASTNEREGSEIARQVVRAM
ncbi:MAG: MutS-related protein, partial [Solirubrobacteraceae bacterium]